MIMEPAHVRQIGARLTALKGFEIGNSHHGKGQSLALRRGGRYTWSMEVLS